MASLLGPQWLCECNESGGADTVEGAGAGAAQHFLYHHDRGDAEAVSVYKERNQWLYTISTMEGATEAIKRESATEGKTTFTAPFSLPAGATVEMKDGSGTGIYTVLSTDAKVDGTFTHAVRKATESVQRFADMLGQYVQEPAAPGPSASREERRRFEQGVGALMPLPGVARPARPMPGVDIGNMSFAEANEALSKMLGEQLRASTSKWNATHGR